MKRINSFLIFTCIAIVLSISCEEEDSGIFNDTFKSLYGEWELYSVSGGFGGSGHELNFDNLIVEKQNNYSIVKNDTIQEYGKIIIKEQDSEELLIEFVLTEGELPFMIFPSANVKFYGSDTLSLNGTCCDWYNYHFVRK